MEHAAGTGVYCSHSGCGELAHIGGRAYWCRSISYPNYDGYSRAIPNANRGGLYVFSGTLRMGGHSF